MRTVSFDKTFWWLMLFPALALAIAGLIVWWTIPRRKPEASVTAKREDREGRAD